MSLFKELFTATDDLIKSIRLPFVEKSLKRGLESARDNAEKKISENELERINLIRNAVKENNLDEKLIEKMITMQIEVSDQNKIIEACDKLQEDLFSDK